MIEGKLESIHIAAAAKAPMQEVGEVRVRGIRLCEPCSHLEALLGQKIIHPLLHRAGLRAAILSEGTIRAGDSIRG